MDVDDEIHGQAGKRSRRNEEKLKQKPSVLKHQEEEDEDGERKGQGERSHHDRSWHSERIFRVSRATGGKDRHSKVITAKGLRDRRVRLSVSTAIQFYDIQDRLGFDQPSKAIEWLIDAAATDIAQLPLLNDGFLDSTKQITSSEQQNQHLSLSKSACSSPSETSKGSVLSLSRSAIRVKARERARDRTAKEKKESHLAHPKSINLPSNGSFTELLTGYASHNNLISTARQNPFFAQTHHQHSYHTSDNLDHLQQLSLLQDHFMPGVAAGAGSDYNVNFSISSAAITGFNRGTLQSNSVSMAPHLQLFSSSADGQNLPIFAGTAATAVAAAGENQLFDGHLQICYGNSNRHSDFKGKN